jgi:hypothetical protein
MPDIDSNQDVMDSRDIEERIDELEAEQGALIDAIADEENAQAEAALCDSLSKWNNENAEELASLKAFRDEMADYCPDWTHGTTLVRDSYWKEYVQEMLADIGDIPEDLPAYIVIDWNRTADNIQVDYTSGEFDGVTYWAR